MQLPVTCQKLTSDLTCLIQTHLLDSNRVLSLNEDLFDAGLESMGVMQLLLQLEEKFGVVVPDADVTRANFQSIQALGALIERLRNPLP